jgi:hypothetical protein
MVELIDFINQEKVHKKINSKKILNIFNKCIVKSIIELDSKFKSINNKQKSIISGINMIYNVFIILILYSNNIKLTIFLVERSILLYSEFIIMSQDKKMINEICFLPNITDAISFSYKKTIGPLKINGINKSNNNILKELTLLMKHITIKKYSENTFSILELSETNNKLEPLLYELFTIIDSKLYTYIINFIININITNIENIIKSMIYYINNKDIEKFKDCFNSIYYNKIDKDEYILYINQIL